MANLLNGGVMTNLLSAESNAMLSQVAHTQYVIQKNQGGDGARALRYAIDHSQKSQLDVAMANDALKENAAAAEEEREAIERADEKKAEKEAEIEAAKAASDAREAALYLEVGQPSVPQQQPAAVLDLSRDYIASVAPVVPGETPAPEPDKTISADTPTPAPAPDVSKPAGRPRVRPASPPAVPAYTREGKPS